MVSVYQNQRFHLSNSQEGSLGQPDQESGIFQSSEQKTKVNLFGLYICMISYKYNKNNTPIQSFSVQEEQEVLDSMPKVWYSIKNRM